MTTSHTPFFVLDHRRVVLVFNRGCEELTGWNAGEVIGKNCDYLASPIPDQVECLTSALCPPEAAFQGQSVSSNVVLRHQGGEILKQTIHFHPLTDEESEDGKQRVMGVITPLGERPTHHADRHFELGELMANLHRRYAIDRFVAHLPSTKQLAEQIAIARTTHASLWFVGESGTGKEHLARLIHYGSPLKLSRFIPIRCGSSSHFELQRVLRQLQEEADLTATVYLDQVDQIPRDLQETILELMQRHQQLRWMCSSFKDMSTSHDSHFSSTLKHQLSTITLLLPTLRDRAEELLLLTQQVLEECNRDQEKQVERISVEVERLFLQYNWPGNVDELSRVIQTSWTACSTETIEAADLPVDFRIGFDAQQIGPAFKRLPLEEYLQHIERAEITRVLSEVNGNKSIAAKILGVPRAKLYRRLEALNIETDESVDSEDEN